MRPVSCVLDFVVSFHSNVLKNQTGTLPHESCVADWREVALILAYCEFSDRILAQHCVFFEIFDTPPQSHRFVLWSRQGEEPPHQSSSGLLTHPNITTLLQLKVSTAWLQAEGVRKVKPGLGPLQPLRCLPDGG